jgi:protein O-GlcNAc transferase
MMRAEIQKIVNETRNRGPQNLDQAMLRKIKKYLKQNPCDLEAREILGVELFEKGEYGEARREFQRIIALQIANPIARFALMLMWPFSTEDFQKRLDRWNYNLSTLHKVTSLRDSYEAGCALLGIGQMFHRRLLVEKPNCLNAQKAVSFFTEEISKKFAPQYFIPLCRRRRSAEEKIKLGFVSAHWDSTELQVMGTDWLESLDERKYEKTLIDVSRSFGTVPERMKKASHKLVELEFSLFKIEKILETLAAADFDAIIYLDQGNMPCTSLLPVFRLAPVQCVTFRYETTTALTNVDFRIISGPIEDANSQELFTEIIVSLENSVSRLDYFFSTLFHKGAAR